MSTPMAHSAPGLTQGKSDQQASAQSEPPEGLCTLLHAAAEIWTLLSEPGHRDQALRAYLKEPLLYPQ